jgi:aryl-alcohol dehydrogenase-like predicted oxidoreductase
MTVRSDTLYNLGTALAGTAAGLVLDHLDRDPKHIHTRLDIPRRPLGRTGLRLPMLCLGGQSVLQLRFWERHARRILNHALDIGIDHLDTAPVYSQSQARIGRFVGHRRSEYTLATKTQARTYDGVLRDVEASLSALRTDRVDLLFIHSLDDAAAYDGLFRGARPGIEAFLRLKAEGIVGAIGASSDRGPGELCRALAEGVLDAVMVPVNPADVHHASYIKRAIPAARAQGCGVLAMQVFANGRALSGMPGADAGMLLRYALSQDIDAAVVGADSIRQLEANARVCVEGKFLDEDAQRHLEAMAAPVAAQINRFKRPCAE